MIPKLTF